VNNKNTRILEIIDSLGWCGTKEQTYLITKYLSSHFEVELALAYGHREMVERLEGIVPLRFYEIDNGSKRRFNPMNYIRLYRILKKGNYDIVVANSSWAFNYLRVVIPFLKKKPKLIAMRRSGYIPSLISKYLKYRIADKIVVVSKDVAEELKKHNFFPEKLVVIESGIDLSRFKPSSQFRNTIREELGIKNDEKLFINIANWQPWRKGQDILLEAFSQLSCPKCKLALVGNRTDSQEAVEMVKRLGLEEKVLLLGFRPDVEKLLQGADYFILSSKSEGIAGSVLQAMASGKVVLSTNAGGIGEYLKDGYNGFLVEVGDIPGMVKKMEKMISLSDTEYKRIANKAVETAKKYSFEETAKKWTDLINQLVPKSSF